jgi:hypothetical protein
VPEAGDLRTQGGQPRERGGGSRRVGVEHGHDDPAVRVAPTVNAPASADSPNSSSGSVTQTPAAGGSGQSGSLTGSIQVAHGQCAGVGGQPWLWQRQCHPGAHYMTVAIVSVS